LNSNQTRAQIEHQVVPKSIRQRPENAKAEPRRVVRDGQLRDSALLIR
jgi:hypothetical protein